MSGYGTGLFGANDSITREQLAVTLYQYAGVMGYDTTAAADLSAFADGGKRFKLGHVRNAVGGCKRPAFGQERRPTGSAGDGNPS